MPAQAAPKPSLKESQAKLKKLNSQVDHQDNIYNKAKEERQAAKKKLDALNKSVSQDKKTYEQLRIRVVQLAAAAYKSGQSGDIPALVSSSDPADVLDQISVFTQVARNRSSEVTQFLNAAQLLQRQKAQAQQAADDLNAKLKSEQKQLASLKKKAGQQRSLVNRLGGGVSSSGGHGGTYTGPASGSARLALEYAYEQKGAPYRYGGTGPYSSGFDCSGLVMMAWRHAGVSLPRVVPDQYNATRRVARSDLQPGDLVFFDSLNHVGIYVGNNQFMHAPHTGTVVQIESLSGYYSSAYYGAGRP
ncbi:cell wall-associated NlpC family hydrolase [Actinoallomurus bryophytorum]|uniref:Cell wall-associated NlpC family hydrolase n=1 Tax=Actinoallomurus bryophytorum TaxID=1490222 RepID=A0A543CCA1_9ACTN|nr:C40 family peptidase [Actinoallomurus bryophytorum]TQL94709.1 cell wall-associated NlpC family hydrolase [Actinoallomurus bryophytorum]